MLCHHYSFTVCSNRWSPNRSVNSDSLIRHSLRNTWYKLWSLLWMSIIKIKPLSSNFCLSLFDATCRWRRSCQPMVLYHPSVLADVQKINSIKKLPVVFLSFFLLEASALVLAQSSFFCASFSSFSLSASAFSFILQHLIFFLQLFSEFLWCF